MHARAYIKQSAEIPVDSKRLHEVHDIALKHVVAQYTQKVHIMGVVMSVLRYLRVLRIRLFPDLVVPVGGTLVDTAGTDATSLQPMHVCAHASRAHTFLQRLPLQGQVTLACR